MNSSITTTRVPAALRWAIPVLVTLVWCQWTYGQASQGTLQTINEENQRTVDEVQVARTQALQQQRLAQAANGAVSQANAALSGVFGELRANNLDNAAAKWLAARDTGVWAKQKQMRETLEAQANNVAKETARLAPLQAPTSKPGTSGNITPTTRGPNSEKTEASLREIDANRQSLANTEQDYLQEIVQQVPELEAALKRGLSQADIRNQLTDGVIHGDTLAHQARILRINEIIAENLPRIIRERSLAAATKQLGAGGGRDPSAALRVDWTGQRAAQTTASPNPPASK